MEDPVVFLKSLFDQTVEIAAPAICLPEHLPTPPTGKTLVVAIGKAAASMAASVEQHWPEEADLSGFALTRYGHGVACKKIKVIEAAHPIPDMRGHEAALEIVSQVKSLTKDDLLLFLVSGGGSALFALPVEGIPLESKKQINKSLLMSGAPIGEMNIVRKHLSAVKGGRVAALAQPAKIVTLAISDVPGDDPSTIASGPTVPDKSTRNQALSILQKYRIGVSGAIVTHLSNPSSETPKSGDPAFENSSFALIASPSSVLEKLVGQQDLPPEVPLIYLGANIEGEAKEVAQQQAAKALEQTSNCLIISGGETTVTVNSDKRTGKGGRNCAYLLALAIALDGAEHIYALAADTDGIDGSETNAGAIIKPDTLERGKALGLDAQAFLDRHDSYSYFEKLGDLIVTGPTRTNVNDFRAIYVGSPSTA